MSIQTQINRITQEVTTQSNLISQLQATLDGEAESVFAGYTKVYRKVSNVRVADYIGYQGVVMEFVPDMVVFTDFMGIKVDMESSYHYAYRPAPSVCFTEMTDHLHNYLELYCWDNSNVEYKIQISQVSNGFYIWGVYRLEDKGDGQGIIWHRAPTMTLNYVAVKYTE